MKISIFIHLLIGVFSLSCSTTQVVNSKQIQSQIDNNLANPKTIIFEKLKKGDLKNTEGPLKLKEILNYSMPISRNESIKMDLFIPETNKKLPLVVFSHGNYSFKEAHYYQGKRLASWGFNVITLQLPNRKQWLKNGRRISSLIRQINANSELISNTVDPSKIVLIGHSFGGSAVSIAASLDTPIIGLILLDPAIVHDSVAQHLRKINVPALLIGADRQVFLSRKRNWFFENIKSDFLEITIKGSTHNDAQYPSLGSLNNFGFDRTTSKNNQEEFLASILVGAFSLTRYGNFDFARKNFANKSFSEKIVDIKSNNTTVSYR